MLHDPPPHCLLILAYTPNIAGPGHVGRLTGGLCGRHTVSWRFNASSGSFGIDTGIVGSQGSITYAWHSGIPASTLRDRDHGRISKQERAANQQYLSPQEERSLVEYSLGVEENRSRHPMITPGR